MKISLNKNVGLSLKRLISLVAIGALVCAQVALAGSAAHEPTNPGRMGSPAARAPLRIVLAHVNFRGAHLLQTDLHSSSVVPIQALLQLSPPAQEKMAVVLARTRGSGLWEIRGARDAPALLSMETPTGLRSSGGLRIETPRRSRTASPARKVQEVIETVLLDFSLKRLQTAPADDLVGVIGRMADFEAESARGLSAPVALSRAGRERQHRDAASDRPLPPQGDAASLSPRQLAATKTALAMNGLFVLIQSIGAVMTGSAMLKADATHNGIDTGLMAALVAAAVLARRSSGKAGILNYQRVQAAMTALVAFAVILTAGETAAQAVEHLAAPVAVPGGSTLALAFAGLAANTATTWILYPYMKQNSGLKTIVLHYVVDIMGSIGVIVSSLLMMTHGWSWLDPMVGFLIATLVLWGGVPLMVSSFKDAVARPAPISAPAARPQAGRSRSA